MPVEEEPPEGAPEWIVTFTDLISLLVTFFVLLMTFSSFEDDNKNLMVIQGLSMTGKRGAVSDVKGPSLVDPPPRDVESGSDPKTGAQDPHPRPAEDLSEDLLEMGKQKTDDRQEIDLTKARDGLRIVFPKEVGFLPGSTEVQPGLRRKLLELAEVLQAYPNTVVLEGHTDSMFASTPEFPTAVDLALARAQSAAQVMLEVDGLDPLTIQVVGHGDRNPRGPNETAEQRVLNRRVEVRIQGLSKARADALQRRAREGGR